MNKKQVVKINEQQLKQIVNESVKRILNEQYGVDFDDTLAWVKRKKPNMSPQEQNRFAQSIINKQKRQNQNQPLSKKPKQMEINGHEILFYKQKPVQNEDGSIIITDEGLLQRKYDVVARYGVFVNKEFVGYLLNFDPPVVSSGVIPFVDELKQMEIPGIFWNEGYDVDYD